LACHLKIGADPDLDPVYHFDADADPDPADHFDADADPDPTFQSDADPDPQHWFVHRRATYWEPRKCLKAVCTVCLAGITSGLENRGSKGIAR
jgi:hypothetical protein